MGFASISSSLKDPVPLSWLPSHTASFSGMQEPTTCQPSPSSAVPCCPGGALLDPSVSPGNTISSLPRGQPDPILPLLCSAVPTTSARAPQVCSTNISKPGEIPLDCCPISQASSSSTSTLTLSLPSVPPALQSPVPRFLPKVSELSDLSPALHTFSHA